MSERVFADNYRKSFRVEEEFLNFLQRREDNSWWRKVKSNDVRFFALDSEHQNAKELKEKLGNAGKHEVFQDTMENTQLYMKVHEDRFLVRNCAIKTILERAKVSGNALNKVEKHVFAMILNYCMEVASGDALMRFSEDKLSAIHGGDASDYSVLDMPELFAMTTEYLQDNFSGYVFAGASYDHSIVTALWSIEDALLLDTYKKCLEENGMPSEKLQLGLRLTSSDTGLSGANLYPMMFIGSEGKSVPLGSPLKLEHKNKANLLKFEEMLNLLYGQYNKALGGIQRMMITYLNHPVNAMLGVMKKLGVSKKHAYLIVEDFKVRSGGGPCRVYEAYIAIAELIHILQCEGVTGARIVQMEENIARAIAMRWKDYDISGEYKW